MTTSQRSKTDGSELFSSCDFISLAGLTNLNFGDEASNSLVARQKKPTVRISYFRDHLSTRRFSLCVSTWWPKDNREMAARRQYHSRISLFI